MYEKGIRNKELGFRMNMTLGHPECSNELGRLCAEQVEVYRRMCVGFDTIFPSSRSLSLTKLIPLLRGAWGVLLLLLFLLFPIFSFAQQLETAEADTSFVEPLDLETVQAELDFLKRKYQKDFAPLIAMDNHYTAFFGQSANFWGLKLGLEMFKKYRVGFGGYYMPRKVAMAPILEENAMDSTYQKFRMHYYTAFFEWVFIKNFRWELAMPVSLGYGRAEMERWIPGRNENVMGRWVEGKDLNEFVATWSVNAHYKIFSWVGVGLGLGWRQIVTPNQEIQQGFSGVILSYKVKLFVGDLYKSFFKPHKILEEKGDYRWRKFMKKNLKRLKREEARRLHEQRRR